MKFMSLHKTVCYIHLNNITNTVGIICLHISIFLPISTFRHVKETFDRQQEIKFSVTDSI